MTDKPGITPERVAELIEFLDRLDVSTWAYDVDTGASDEYTSTEAATALRQLQARVAELEGDKARLAATFSLKWVCSVVASGYHNGAACHPDDPHGGDWRCEYRRVASIPEDNWQAALAQSNNAGQADSGKEGGG